MRGFERPSNKAMSSSWDKRLGAAEQALAIFGSAAHTAGMQLDQSAAMAGAGLGELGKGMGQAGVGFGQFLASLGA